MSITRHRHLCRTTALAGGLLASLAASAAFAQTASHSDAGPSAVSEVIVTAEKRQERLLSAPAPVTAVLATTLARQGAVRLDDYANLVPGLNLFGTRPGEEAIVLRGISTGTSNSTTTAVYINDTPVGGSTAQDFDNTGLDVDPGTLQRIEVLRGPQGTLYGANALGGIVKYVVATPSLTHYSARIELDGTQVDGGGDGGGVHAMLDGPIIDGKLGFTLTGFDRVDPGFIDNPTLGQKNANRARTYGGRLALEWQPTDRLSIDGSVTIQDSSSGASSEELVDANLKPVDGGKKQFFFTPTPLRLATDLYSLSVGYDFGWARLLSISSYEDHTRKAVQDVSETYGPLIGLPTPPIGLRFPDDPFLHKFTQEIRLASNGDGPIEWQTGFYFTHERSGTTQSVDAFDTTTQAPFDLGLGEPLFFGVVKAQYTEYAGYADVTYHVTPQLQIQGGLRESANSQTHNFPSTGLLAGGTSTVTGGSSDNSLTYLVTPKYTFNANNMVYARIASGYRPGGPNNGLAGLTGRPTSFGPDTLTNYEVGYKGAWLDRTLTLDVSAFDIEWKNIQILETIAGVSETGNGAAARSYGFEGAASWTPIRGLSLAATLALTNAALTQDAPGVNGLSGDRLPYSPQVEASLSGDYDFPIASAFSGFVGASYHHVGDRKTDFEASAPAGFERPTFPAYDTVDLRAGVDHGGIEVEFYIKNVGDAGGLTNLQSANIDGVSAPLYAGIIQPRTFGVSLTAKY
jgi:iron complex outermembrane receptor protein